MTTQTTTKTNQGGGRAAMPAGKGVEGVGRRSPAASKSSRLHSWKATLFQSLGRELTALHRQHQERAFMATSHGLAYRSDAVIHTGTLH